MNKQTKVFIDGREGTTGLKIVERLQNRSDIHLLSISDELRKNTQERKKYLNDADIVFLCLPDDAAKEAVALIEQPHVRVIDASTAHRTHADWVYGLPELSDEQRGKIKDAARVAVPGCYASGFIVLLYPLIRTGVIASDFPIFVHAVSGYSGGGKSAIAQYEAQDKEAALFSPRQYAGNQNHKHLPEMQHVCGLLFPPMFCPMIDDYYAGMLVNIPIQTRMLQRVVSLTEMRQILETHYDGQQMIRVCEPEAFLPANGCSGKNHMEIYISGNDERILLTARLDNLGKGASGAAVQCMNIMMGIEETTGLL